jgi:NAD(P)-dependent dehydrogenase (short-subunit alcohol dehydrogenase family)
MTMTLEELCELLKERVDPDLLLEELDISTEELVDRFEDKIEQRFNRLTLLVEV